ncbi:MAG: hypothetical protein Q9160_008948 [Pyrenula sp. 1 TL-2023]
MSTRVIVIGAGVAGLSAAKTYLQINPSIQLTILDENSTVGGIWSKQRLYSSLICQSPTGYYEFSDLTAVDEEHPQSSLLLGSDVHRYLEKYARHHDLLKYIKFDTRVTKARRQGDGWVLTTHDDQTWTCDKLIVSTGLFSEPQAPEIPQERFNGPVMHSKYLGPREEELRSDKVKDVVVVGGCKSAVEAISLCLDAGKRVHWVLRERARGVPIIIADPKSKINLLAIGNTRLFSLMSPSIFATVGFFYNFLHSGLWLIGTWIFNRYWALLSALIRAAPKYEKSFNGKIIKPKIENQLWLGSYVSLVYTDGTFHRFMHNEDRLKIHQTSLKQLANGMADLSNGTSIPADAVVYCTGWTTSTGFFTLEDAIDLGLPVPVSSQPTEIASHWSKLNAEADSRVSNLLPSCRSPEFDTLEQPGTTQFRTYRTIISPHLLSRRDRSIAFLGFVANAHTATTSELTALWAIAWMEDMFLTQLPTREEMEKHVALVNNWMARRYGSRGAVSPEIILESQSFLDEVMKDLGLNPYRKKAKSRRGLGWLWEYCSPYGGVDYKGVVEEFLDKAKRRKKLE